MDPQTQLLSPTEPANSFVFVDVYAWLRAIETHQRLVMEGVFRHADALCRLYTPAIFLSSSDARPHPFALEILEHYLGRHIVVTNFVEDIADAGCNVWLSLAVDFPAPFLSLKTPFKKVAILHDTLAGQGVFGADKSRQFLFGATHNDAFAYVSVASFNQFQCYRQPKQQFIKYGCFHTFDSLPPRGEHYSDEALAVHSLYRRKSIEAEAQLSRSLGLRLHHVGQRYDDPFDATDVVFHGPVNDEELYDLYQQCGTFICLSSAEGFSMPPMEAIIHGVPRVYLSDIPAHREVYGSLIVSGKPIPFAKRYALFDRYRKENVMRDLIAYLAAI